ncbi:DUF3427 domain-containing protein [Corynebacterium gerontici]|uniref:ATP-dependent RNA helicase SrmB n=1 Tax=Corynebacterium gerontici TaxID=2079234 RepID=A0A3G6IZR4_9CORY|nr:DEAD/DEAH box helicase [Corynebacterium gerontici]AZA11187.1 ATP-dependent RNA helicase SrmB [Corynebacterium gerontici]
MKSLQHTLADDLVFGFLDRTQPSEQIFHPKLIANVDENVMLTAIKQELHRCTDFTFSVAFITPAALALLKESLLQFQGRGRIITSRYLDFNQPDVFRELLLLNNVEVFIHDDRDAGFHAKGYVFDAPDGITAIVGSSNLTDKALLKNHEWNLRFSAFPGGDIALQLRQALDQQVQRSQPLTPDWIRDYENDRKQPVFRGLTRDQRPTQKRILPNAMQSEALDAIDEMQSAGARRALVISATGTGKTILAALAVRASAPKRLLFIAHREQILDKAREEFIRVLDEKREQFGLFVGRHKHFDCKYVFASIQSLSSKGILEAIGPRDFDYVIIDEVHRSGAGTYRRVIDHLKPDFLLGLTATPERADQFNVFELFDHNVPYEIRLQKALEADMLVPFHYYGVTDYSLDGAEINEKTELHRLVAEERVRYVVEMLRKYGHPNGVCGLMFCSRRKEAEELSKLFNQQELHGRPLRTVPLSGEHSVEHRNETIRKLEAGELDYILTVDILNEGVDIPAVNQIVMLRPTQSAIVFTQQLGRGLRKAKNKDHLRVIDFIANYKNNYMIPVALFGDNSRSKDRLRKALVSRKGNNAIAGLSSVNFDRIAEERILNAIDKAPLNHLSEMKKEILALQARLNRVPKLFDFAVYDSVEPLILATKVPSVKNYWDLLVRVGLRKDCPTKQQRHYLNFLSKEILPGKRPHELVLLKYLLDHHQISTVEFSTLLSNEGFDADEATIESALRVLDYSFYVKTLFGESPLIERDAGMNHLSADFQKALEDPTFEANVRDVIRTGLFTSAEVYGHADSLVLNNKYTRREVTRLLRYPKDKSETIFGYAANEDTQTIPIFVTYRKDHRFSEETSYEDAFESEDLLRWYTRRNRRLDSPEVQRLLSGEYRMPLFAQRSKDEGDVFYYLGDVLPTDRKQERMETSKGKVDIVQIDLKLQDPVSPELYRYFTADGELT